MFANTVFRGNFYANDTVYSTISSFYQFAFCEWDTAGNFIKALPIATTPTGGENTYYMYGSPIISNHRGEMIITGGFKDQLFVGDFTLNGLYESNAFIAKYSDSSLVEHISIVGNEILCLGDSVVLTAKGGSRFFWSTGAETRSITVAPTETTSYSVTGFTANHCEVGTESFTVSVVPKPEVEIDGDAEICIGDYTLLTASFGDSQPVELFWNTGDTTQSITVAPTATTNYSITIVDENGCEKTAEFLVTVFPAASETLNIGICQGESYDFCGNTLSEGGIYECTLQTVHGCDSLITLQLSVHPIPDITISGNTLVFLGESTTLTANFGSAIPQSFLWNTGATTQSITVTPTENTLYSVIGTDINGCSDSASVMVEVHVSIDELHETDLLKLIPNPANNQVALSGIEAKAVAEIEVIDLTGNIVLSTRQTVVIDLSSLASGMYIVCVKNNEGKVYYLKLVKM